jgi:hypothetical protein
MEPTSVSHALHRLALCLTILILNTPIEASPNRPAASPLPGHPPLGTTSDQAKDLILPLNVRSTQDAESDNPGSSFDVPCLQGTSSQNSPPLDSADHTCGEPPESQQRFGLGFGHRMITRNRMLGDLDGLKIDYGLGNFALNVIAGFPAVSGKEAINPKNRIFGMSAASGRLANAWDLNGYYMERQDSGRQHTSALGGALKYSQTNRSLLISADYDMLNHTLSRFMISSAWKPLPNSVLSSTIAIHQGFLPTPRQDVLQQGMALPAGWKWGLPFKRIKKLCMDSSTDVAALGLGVSHAFSQNIKLDGNLAMLNVSRDDAPDPTASISDVQEYFFYLKLTRKDLLLAGDTSSITLRHNAGATSEISSSILNGSYAIDRRWNLAPRLQIDYTNNPTNDSIDWFASPAMQVEYHWHKQSRIRFKAAVEWSKHQDSVVEENHTSYVVNLGYKTWF